MSADDRFESKCSGCGVAIWMSLDLTVGDIKDDPTLEMCDHCADATVCAMEFQV